MVSHFCVCNNWDLHIYLHALKTKLESLHNFYNIEAHIQRKTTHLLCLYEYFFTKQVAALNRKSRVEHGELPSVCAFRYSP